jgi:hypothetical protein
MMRFSYSAVWADTVKMLKSHGSLIAAVAGVFLLLPTLLTGYFLPQPAPNEAEPFAPMLDHFVNNWPWLMLGNLFNMIGAIAIYLLLLRGRDQTVGRAIAAALPILPFYLLMSILTNLAIGIGLGLFILPGIYLLGRLFPSSPVLVAEQPRNPLAAVKASWALTRGRGWAVAGLVAIVFLVGMLVSFVITAVVSSIVIVTIGREGVGGMLVLILSSALTAALYTVLTVLVAAIYRALSGEAPSSVDLAKGI